MELRLKADTSLSNSNSPHPVEARWLAFFSSLEKENHFSFVLEHLPTYQLIRSAIQSKLHRSNFRRKGRASVDIATGRRVLVDAVLFALLFKHTL